MEVPEHLQGLSGGELAAAIPGQTRIDMIGKGYNILSESDVSRYYKGQSSEKSIHISAGVGKVNSMGEGHMDYKKDYAAIRREMGDNIPFDQDENFDVNDEDDTPQVKTPTKKNVANVMENYEHSTNRLDSKVKSVLESRQNLTQNQRPTQKVAPQTQQKGPIAIPKKIVEKQMITEAAQAKREGYNSGVRYLNSFINLLKQPSSANREALLVEINKMVLKEETIHPNLLATYRAGVSEAEKQLYLKIHKK